MKVMINNASMQPIYEQLVEQIRKQILQGDLQEQDALPSVRALAKELKISALTVKKAYDYLEEEGLIATIHGKGSFILAANPSLIREERQREVEECLELAVTKGRNCGMSDEELRELLNLVLDM